MPLLANHSNQFDSLAWRDDIEWLSQFQLIEKSPMSDNQDPDIDLVSMSQLVNSARDGDRAAHSEICRQVQGQLNRMADKHLDAKLRRKLNPSDIVQATLTRMVQGFGDFRGSTSAEFYGWLNTILKNEVNSTRRDFQRQRRDINRESEANSAVVREFTSPSVDAPDQQLRTSEKLAQFQQVITRLSPDHAQVIELRGIQELPFEEVAQRMERSVNAVSKLWARALICLQQELTKLDDSFTS